MKNHIAILIGALALCSCEDYLTQENPNKIESEYYFTDESSLEIYTNGFIRSFATAIKSFVDGDKNADTHSHGTVRPPISGQLFASDATNWGRATGRSCVRSTSISTICARPTHRTRCSTITRVWGVSSARCSITPRCVPSGPCPGTRNRSRRPTRRRSSGSRQPRIRLPQDSRRSRLRLHLLLDGGFLQGQPGVVHSSLRGPRAQSAFLPLRGDDAQIPHARSLDGPAVAVGRECDVPRRVRQGVRGDHRRRRLPFDRQCRRPPHAVPCDVHQRQCRAPTPRSSGRATTIRS